MGVKSQVDVMRMFRQAKGGIPPYRSRAVKICIPAYSSCDADKCSADYMVGRVTQTPLRFLLEQPALSNPTSFRLQRGRQVRFLPACWSSFAEQFEW